MPKTTNEQFFGIPPSVYRILYNSGKWESEKYAYHQTYNDQFAGFCGCCIALTLELKRSNRQLQGDFAEIVASVCEPPKPNVDNLRPPLRIEMAVSANHLWDGWDDTDQEATKAEFWRIANGERDVDPDEQFDYNTLTANA